MRGNKFFIIMVAVVAVFTVIAARVVLQNQNKNEQVPPEIMALLVKDHSPTLGSKDAPVHLVEFLDPECESCAAMDPIVKGLVKEYEGKIFYTVRYMPFHGNSAYAAAMLEEAREQGKYWESLSTLFHQIGNWGDHHEPKPELIKGYLTELGVKFDSLDDKAIIEKHSSKIKLDETDGKRLGVKYTPTFFVNGRMLADIGYEPIKEAIEAALKK